MRTSLRMTCNFKTLRIVGRSCVLSLAFLLSLSAGCTQPTSRAGDKDAAPKPRTSRGKGAPWTIQCTELQGLGGVSFIEDLAEGLRRTPGIRSADVFTRRESDGFTRLYYGSYHRQLNPRTGRQEVPADMRRDLDWIRGLGDGSRKFFAAAMPVRMPQADMGRPEWALSGTAGVYSLQIAVFEPNDEFFEFKQAAAEMCELLRSKGYEAYYHHTRAASTVTVGSFGEDAVIQKKEGEAYRTYYNPRVLEMQKDELLKYNLLNGAVYSVRGDSGERVLVPSRLVRIPRIGESLP